MYKKRNNYYKKTRKSSIKKQVKAINNFLKKKKTKKATIDSWGYRDLSEVGKQTKRQYGLYKLHKNLVEDDYRSKD